MMGQMGDSSRKRTCPKDLVGDSCEVNVMIDNVNCRGLLDSGSVVSTISETFYKTYLKGTTMFDIQDILRLEGA